jgi:trans-aconitate methyltransferase
MADYIKAYENLEATVGGIHSIGWNSETEQWMRFNQLDRMLRENVGPIESLDIHDLGCGYGDLIRFWKNTPPRDYIGTDAVPSFIDKAKLKYPDNKFLVLDSLKETPPEAEVTVMCGSLCFHDINSKAILLTKVAEKTSKAVLFTMWTGPTQGDRWYLNERRIVEYAASLGTKLIRNGNLYDMSEHMFLLLK